MYEDIKISKIELDRSENNSVDELTKSEARNDLKRIFLTELMNFDIDEWVVNLQ